MTRLFIARISLVLTMVGLPHRAQSQATIPIRTLAAAEATSTDTISVQTRVWQRADGRVVVSSVRSGRLLLLEQNLASSRVLTDSAMVNPTATPMRSLLALPFAGDSTAVVDIGTSALVVLDAAGKQMRVMAFPHARDVSTLSTAGMIPLAIDPKQRVVYRGAYPPVAALAGTTTTSPPDSAPLVRVDFDARRVDTIGVINTRPTVRTATTMNADGATVRRTLANPMRPVDDWTMTSDGTIALVRGHDYHIDWIGADGRTMATPKMAFDWRRVTDDEKERLVDSLRTFYGQMDHMMDSMAAARGGPSLTKGAPERVYAPLGEVADYYIPIRPNNVVADADNRVWILPTTSSQAQGGLLYDVVSARGALVERVQLPPGASLVGFGPGGVLYLRAESATGAHLVRTHILR